MIWDILNQLQSFSYGHEKSRTGPIKVHSASHMLVFPILLPCQSRFDRLLETACWFRGQNTLLAVLWACALVCARVCTTGLSALSLCMCTNANCNMRSSLTRIIYWYFESLTKTLPHSLKEAGNHLVVEVEEIGAEGCPPSFWIFPPRTQ